MKWPLPGHSKTNHGASETITSSSIYWASNTYQTLFWALYLFVITQSYQGGISVYVTSYNRLVCFQKLNVLQLCSRNAIEAGRLKSQHGGRGIAASSRPAWLYKTLVFVCLKRYLGPGKTVQSVKYLLTYKPEDLNLIPLRRKGKRGWSCVTVMWVLECRQEALRGRWQPDWLNLKVPQRSCARFNKSSV